MTGTRSLGTDAVPLVELKRGSDASAIAVVKTFALVSVETVGGSARRSVTTAMTWEEMDVLLASSIRTMCAIMAAAFRQTCAYRECQCSIVLDCS